MATAVKRISAPSSAQIEDVLVAVGLGDWLDKSKTRIFLKSVPTLQAVRISLDASLQLAPERATISAVRLGQPAAVQSILAARERSGKEQARVHFRSGSRPEWIDIDSLNVVGQEKARNLFSVDIDTAAKRRRRPRSDRKLASQKQRKAKRVHSRMSYSQANYVQQKSSESDETTSENRAPFTCTNCGCTWAALPAVAKHMSFVQFKICSEFTESSTGFVSQHQPAQRQNTLVVALYIRC